MPDILIRMEMPKSCSDCPFEVFGDCYGGKVKRIMDIEDYMERGERHPDCPLIELPPHGELIDRAALVAEIKKDDTYQNWLFRKMIEKQPIISPDEVRGVVHCCNCYHAEPRNPVGEKTEIFCRLFIAGMREDDFCSRGEFLTNCGAKMEVSEDA